MFVLAWVGRQKTQALVVVVLVALALPPLGAILRPYVTEAVIGMLCIAFVRIDVGEFRSFTRHPGLVLAACIWTTVVVPISVFIVFWLLELSVVSPALFHILILQAVAAPMMSAPALAALMGLDGTLVLVVLLLGTAVAPFFAPLLVHLAGLDIGISPFSHSVWLALAVVGSAAVGLVIRKLAGRQTIARYSDELDGLNIVMLFIYACALLRDVGLGFFSEPFMMIGLTALAFAVYFSYIAVGFLVFAPAGAKTALAIGMLTAERNLALMVVSTGGIMPPIAWHYFAVNTFPILLTPRLVRPIARFIDAREKQKAAR
ncbi:MAG: Na+-dependent transporter [Pseudomonadota bacterium]